ncbi:MAG: hypothetical protein K6U09_04360 [Acidobacteriia bacterium]|nr:hypothetical protein [Terriglobia bacterium]
MSSKSLCRCAILLLAAFPLSAQPGTLEIVVRVAPTAGRPEPVRSLPIFLLTKSFAELQAEAERAEPPADFAAFVESLKVSPELKQWMLRKQSAQLSGTEFTRELSADDILNVPEFREAYLARNAGDVTVGFPRARYDERDRERNPEKYEREKRQYLERVRKTIETMPHTKDGMDLYLTHLDAEQRWRREQAERRRRVRHRALELAQTRYLAARAETDLEGRAGFVNVPAGQYWLSTLEGEALVGDVRLRWDVPVAVRPGAVTRIELSNLNGKPPSG